MSDQIDDVLGRFCKKFRHVVYVTGNHEYWKSVYLVVRRRLLHFAAFTHNFHWLDSSAVVIEGQRFLGGTLWFKEDPLAPAWDWIDFEKIKGLKEWVYADNHQTRRFLEAELKDDDIVVTHHLPSRKSVPARFERGVVNAFYVCDMEELIHRAQPKLWVHGHTHDSMDYTIEKTRVVCNPFGYPKYLNPAFSERKIIKV